MCVYFCALPFDLTGLGFILGFDASSGATFLLQADLISKVFSKYASQEGNFIINVRNDCKESNVNDVETES